MIYLQKSHAMCVRGLKRTNTLVGVGGEGESHAMCVRGLKQFLFLSLIGSI